MRGASVLRTSHWDTGPTNTPVPFDTVEYDDDGLWSATAPSILGPMPASYDGLRAVIYATCIWSYDTTYAELKVFRNGDDQAPVAVVEMGSNQWNSGVELTSRPLVLVEGDWFELVARTGDPALARYAPGYSISFSIEVRTGDGAVGPQGPPGPQGLPGPQGPAGGSGEILTTETGLPDLITTEDEKDYVYSEG